MFKRIFDKQDGWCYCCSCVVSTPCIVRKYLYLINWFFFLFVIFYIKIYILRHNRDKLRKMQLKGTLITFSSLNCLCLFLVYTFLAYTSGVIPGVFIAQVGKRCLRIKVGCSCLNKETRPLTYCGATLLRKRSLVLFNDIFWFIIFVVFLILFLWVVWIEAVVSGVI